MLVGEEVLESLLIKTVAMVSFMKVEMLLQGIRGVFDCERSSSHLNETLTGAWCGQLPGHLHTLHPLLTLQLCLAVVAPMSFS